MKLQMISGLPASGKTTYAQSLVDTGNSGRINRDDLRAMVFNGVWTGKREGVIVDIEKAIAEVLIRHKLIPVVDDTNLTPKHRDMWSGFAQKQGVAFEAHDLNPGHFICVERDSKRAKPVGEAIINRMALNAGKIDFLGLPIVLVDIDGTLANLDHRLHYARGTRKDWKSFYAAIDQDEPIDFIIRWVKELYKSFIICIVSGRPDTYQFETLEWLRKHNVPYHFIFMRPGHLKSPDTEIKQAILDMLPKDQIQFVIDDRPSVIRMWKENGLKVYAAQGQCEEF